ncbi:MAG TPA: DUF4097 family beta strand repeat protein [Candidatus Coproplasma stercoravium]|nr:DUF4097 family beta strand repeat protein [Candidatus Coproplasma stercoravium]
MKKLVGLIIAAAAAAMLFSLAACSEQTFTEGSYTLSGTEVKSITVDAEDRAVEVVASTDGNVKVEYYASDKEYYDISADGGHLTVSLVLDKSWTDYVGAQPDISYRTIRMEVPGVALESLKISTTNEKIELSQISATDVSLVNNWGDITFGKMSVGNGAEFVTKNGNISGILAGELNDYSVTCTVKKGSTNLPENKDGGEKTLAVDCNNGDVNIEFSA